jgi:hypothetical protein
VGSLKNYIAQEAELVLKDGALKAIRTGARVVLVDDHKGYTLGKHLANELPYYYRTVEGITADFSTGHHALEAILAMAATLPTSASFQNSHCGEILAAHFIEDQLGFKRLYRKLTLLTSQNTNAHKMDALFVDTKSDPFTYLFVEAKSSVLPTKSTPAKSHRSGILKQMIESLNGYANDDPRFEYARIRDNLEKTFNPDVASRIRDDLIPPGPDNLKVMGVSITNAATVNQIDDDFILSAACGIPFDYHALVVTDLAVLAKDAFGYWEKVKAAGE